jgi:hypothetical protein
VNWSFITAWWSPNAVSTFALEPRRTNATCFPRTYSLRNPFHDNNNKLLTILPTRRVEAMNLSACVSGTSSSICSSKLTFLGDLAYIQHPHAYLLFSRRAANAFRSPYHVHNSTNMSLRGYTRSLIHFSQSSHSQTAGPLLHGHCTISRLV